MKQNDNFSFYLSKYMGEYLPGQRNVSVNTIRSYRDTFILLIRYCENEYGISPDKLKISFFSYDKVESFLTYLENTVHSSISTRNQRLAAIKSFFRFIQVEEPEHLYLSQCVLGLKCKKCEKPIISYLTSNEVQSLLNCPDIKTQKGRRDLALLSLLYDSAARVQELCDIKVSDIRLDEPPVVRLYGKGRKGREVPLSAGCAKILRKYIEENRLDKKGYLDHPLFFNSRNEKLTRSGVSYILNKYMEAAIEQGLIQDKKKITPHCLRHSKAMHLVEAGVNLIYIRDFLGQESVETTQIYAKANPEFTRKAVAKVQPTAQSPEMEDWRTKPDVMAFLKSL